MKIIKKFREDGFTLIELLFVISIISLLASIVLASLNTAREKAQVARAQTDLKNIRSAIALLASDTGKWPNGCPIGQIVAGSTNEVALDQPAGALIVSPVVADTNLPECSWTASEVSTWNGPYISSAKDPWGNSYWFDNDYVPYSNGGLDNCPDAVEPQKIVINSYGPNGGILNEYDCDDIFVELL